MISRYEVYLNNVALSAIDPRILVTDINYTTPSIRNSTYSLAKRQGSHVYNQYVDKASVSVQFQIRAYDIAERQSVCNEVVKWAKNGGVLTTSDRNGQRLTCICETPPVVASAKKWTDSFKIVFAAYTLPFWEEATAKALTLRGSNTNGFLYVPGNVDGALIEVSVKANASLTSVSLIANDKTLILSGLSISTGQTINITYDENLIQSIKVGATSLLNKRTGADDLLAKCGEKNILGMSANASVDTTFIVRGLWL